MPSFSRLGFPMNLEAAGAGRGPGLSIASTTTIAVSAFACYLRAGATWSELCAYAGATVTPTVSASATYYIYANRSAPGVASLSYSTTAPDSNRRYKTGDTSYLLIGQYTTNASSQIVALVPLDVGGLATTGARLGIGTATPIADLHVGSGNLAIAGNIAVRIEPVWTSSPGAYDRAFLFHPTFNFNGLTNAIGMQIVPEVSTGKTVPTLFGCAIAPLCTGAITTWYGLYVYDAGATGVTTKYDAVFVGGGNVGVGTAVPASLLQVGAKGNNEVYNVATRLKIHGSTVTSNTTESLLRGVRNENGANYYPSSFDLKLRSYGAAGAPYLPTSELAVFLKAAANYNEGAEVQVMTLRADKTAGFGGMTAPTAWMHLAAGTSAAGTAQLKLDASTVLATPEAGAIERTTDRLYFTIGTGTARKQMALNDAALTSGRVPIVTTDGRLTDDADLTFSGTTLTPTDLTLGATDWDDVTLTAGRISVGPGTAPPAYSSADIAHQWLKGGATKDLDLSFEIQHSYKEGTSVYLHVHTSNSDANAGNIAWIIKWRVVTPGLAVPAFTTDAVMTVASGSTTNAQILSLKTVADATATIASVFQFNISRDRGGGSDTYAGDVLAYSYGIHYEKNTIGSQSITAK